MLAKLKHNIDDETQALLPEAVEIAKQKKQERLRAKIQDRPVKNYGSGLFSMSNKGYGTISYSSPIAHRLEPGKFKANKKPKIIDWSKKYY